MDRGDAIYWQARHTRFMAGWDACIAGQPQAANPYSREDYRATWANGWKLCEENRPLPAWYAEWRSKKLGVK